MKFKPGQRVRVSYETTVHHLHEDGLTRSSQPVVLVSAGYNPEYYMTVKREHVEPIAMRASEAPLLSVWINPSLGFKRVKCAENKWAQFENIDDYLESFQDDVSIDGLGYVPFEDSDD